MLTMISMYRHSFGNLLMRPSFLSSTFCSLFVVIALIGANWSFILSNLSLYDYFFGPDGLVTVLRYNFGNQSSIGQVIGTKEGNHSVTIIVSTLAATVGLVIAVWLIIKLIGGISMTLREVHAAETPAKHAIEHDLARRAGVRFLVLVLWAAYVYIFVKVALPLCILASQVGMDSKRSVGEGVGYVLFAAAALFVAAHLHVVLARLLLLRPRVFGSEDVVITR